MQRDAGAYLRYVRETNPELTVTLKTHLHDPEAAGGHGVNGEWKRAKKVDTLQLGSLYSLYSLNLRPTR